MDLRNGIHTKTKIAAVEAASKALSGVDLQEAEGGGVEAAELSGHDLRRNEDIDVILQEVMYPGVYCR